MSRRKGAPVNLWMGQVAPRLPSLILDLHLYMALLGGSALAYITPQQPVAKLDIAVLAGAIMALASIAFGACITGAVLAITLAPRERITRWGQGQAKGSHFSHFSELIFVFVWSALAQLALIVVAGLAFIFGGAHIMWPEQFGGFQRVLIGGAGAVAMYAFIQLYNVVKAILQVGVVVEYEATSGCDE